MIGSSSAQIASLLLGGGGAAAIFTLVKAWLAVRSSTDTREATAIGNLEKWRLAADARADGFYRDLVYERELSLYWQRRAAELEVVARLNGATIPPPAPPPVKDPQQEILHGAAASVSSTASA